MQSKVEKNFITNVSFAFAAQGFSMIASVLTSLVVPKLLGVEQLSYWQLFIFYSGYVGLFHFGLSDGIYLRYGGTELNELDKPLIGSQYRLMTLWQALLCAAALPLVFAMVKVPERRLVWVCIAIYLLLANGCWFWGYLYQAANRTRVHSFATVLAKISFIVCICILVALHTDRFEIFIILFVVSQLVAFVYCAVVSRQFIFARGVPFRTTVSETIQNCRIGINLTISNIASSLVLGVGRIFVDMTQEISEFGLLSFSISLTNFFLQFISQISMVMFPALRQIQPERARQLLVSLRRNASFFLCLIMVFYIPLKKILLLWLPQYEVSLNYLGYLLPLCVFDGKMQLLYSTYLKVLRKEKKLLALNLFSLALSAVLCAFGTFVLKDLIAVVCFMVVAIAVRSLLASGIISRELKVPFDSGALWECSLSALFIFTNVKLNTWEAFFAYLLGYCAYLFVYRRYIGELLQKVKQFSA